MPKRKMRRICWEIQNSLCITVFLLGGENYQRRGHGMKKKKKEEAKICTQHVDIQKRTADEFGLINLGGGDCDEDERD